MQSAKFFAKVYNISGTFQRVLDSSLFLNVPTIVREVNKPAGELTIDLALPWDDFGFGDTINPFDLVKVYAVNEANPTGLLVYQGTIEEITGSLNENTDHVSIRLYPIDALLNRSLVKTGGGETPADYTKTYTGGDVDTMFSDMVTDANTIYGSLFTDSLANTGLSVNVSFLYKTHLDIINGAFDLLGSSWFWFLNASGLLELDEYNDVTADHTLTLGKDVMAIDVIKSILDVKNRLNLTYNTSSYANYTDATSIADYGRRHYAATNNELTNLAAANAFGDGEIARQKDLKTKTIIKVNTNYDIETIKPGDTVQVLNKKDGTSQMITGVLRIHRVEYDGTMAILHIADIVDNFGNEFTKAIAA